MQTPLHSIRLPERLTRFAPRGEAAPGGLWSLAGAQLTAVDAGFAGPATVLVPSERVLLLPVELPLPTRRRRMEALPFAIEDAIADPPETVHLALGETVGPGRWLAAVVAHGAMREWMGALAAAGVGDARLVPDALALPVPPEGAWSVDLAGTRALVRAADGTGFALHAEQLAAAWEAAGRPACIALGAPLPEMFGEAAEPAEPTPLAVRLRLLDLRQGAYARPRRRLSATWRRLAIVAGAGVLAHGTIATADTIALRDIAEQREAETRALVTQLAPGRAAAGEDLATVAADLVPSGGAAMPGRFVPLMTRTSRALAPIGAAMTLRGFVFDEAAGTLELTIEAPDVATLQRIEAVLSATGLNATSGGSTAAEGRAEGRITVAERAPA